MMLFIDPMQTAQTVLAGLMVFTVAQNAARNV